MSGDSLYRCKTCNKQFKLSEISTPMKGPLDFVWRAEKCPACGVSELTDDGGYREIWERVGGSKVDSLRDLDRMGKIQGFSVEISHPRSGKSVKLGAEEKEDPLDSFGDGSGFGRCND